MKKIVLLLIAVAIVILAGCYDPDVDEELPYDSIEFYAPNKPEVDLSELEYAQSLDGVYVESFGDNSATSIQDYINDKSYMALIYGGMDIVEDEERFLQIVEERLNDFDTRVAILLKNDEMPLEELEHLYKKLMNTDDQISATLLWYGYSVERVDEGIFIEILNEFTTSAYEYEQVAEKMDELIKTLDLDNLTDYEKVKTLYEYVMDRMTYNDTGMLIAHSPMGFLFHGEGVCQAYAVSLHMLLERAGIESRYVIGNIHEELLYEGETGGHAWNMVKLDGNWYHLDPTWDDDEADWSYFLVSDNIMELSRSWEAKYYEKARQSYN